MSGPERRAFAAAYLCETDRLQRLGAGRPHPAAPARVTERDIDVLLLDGLRLSVLQSPPASIVLGSAHLFSPAPPAEGLNLPRVDETPLGRYVRLAARLLHPDSPYGRRAVDASTGSGSWAETVRDLERQCACSDASLDAHPLIAAQLGPLAVNTVRPNSSRPAPLANFAAWAASKHAGNRSRLDT